MNQSKNAMKLLRKQINKLDEENFDLDAWKGGTESILERLFGPDNQKIQQLKNIKIDYSSWALRDSTSRYNPRDTVKKLGKELLESAIDEIELMGIPEKSNTDGTKKTSQLLEDYLDAHSIKNIETILYQEMPKAQKRNKLKAAIKKLSSGDKSELITALLLLNK